MHTSDGAIASLVVPAHNEETVIRRLLSGVGDEAARGTYEVIVMCNGCTDDTAAVARGYPGVTVLETPTPSKSLALRLGDQHASAYPRLYVDADIELSSTGVGALVAAVAGPGAVIAAGPERLLTTDESSLLVRAYYAVWQRLPAVQSGLFGRGVIAMTESAHQRVAALPDAMSDDLAISEAFTDAERAIVPGAQVVIHVPRTARDLLRRRIRVHVGNAELDRRSGRSAASQTSPRALLGIVRHEPRLAVCLPVFVGVAITAKLIARRRIARGDVTWERDESTR